MWCKRPASSLARPPAKDSEALTPAAAIEWIALSLVPGLGGETYRRLLQRFGLPAHILAADYSDLVEHVSPAVASGIGDCLGSEALKRAGAWLAIPGNQLLTLADSDYPPQLLEISDPPPLLYLKGRRELLAAPSLAVVGSRNATPQGVSNAEAFSRSLSDAGLTIISGLALGIDAAAHRGGLAGRGGSIAVIGTGLDIIYPARNKEIALRLAETGAIVTEFPLGTPAIAANFPRRNRLISGLARGCLVVEATLKSGSLITARLAAEQGREVFAIPGSIHSPLSKGCHSLIKQGAKLVDCAADILDELHLPSPPGSRSKADPVAADDPLLTALGFDPVAIDTLAERVKLPTAEVAARLLTLELDGKLSSLPGGLYQRII
ncbi:MAG: DNA-protecting protein DprA [Burkholderiales bacterium]|nr:DNA-protecting protein DprA [Burkholderiales bacterium]